MKLTKDEATTVCNAIYRYTETILDDPAELDRMGNIYDKVAKEHQIQLFKDRRNEKNDLFFENLPKKQKDDEHIIY